MLISKECASYWKCSCCFNHLLQRSAGFIARIGWLGCWAGRHVMCCPGAVTACTCTCSRFTPVPESYLWASFTCMTVIPFPLSAPRLCRMPEALQAGVVSIMLYMLLSAKLLTSYAKQWWTTDGKCCRTPFAPGIYCCAAARPNGIRLRM